MRVLYFCHYYTDRQRSERGFSARNTAGVNRMRRIARALASAGAQVQIVSPGVSARCRFSPRLLYPGFWEHSDGLEIMALPAVSVPWLSAILEPLIAAWWFLKSVRPAPPDFALVYNFAPSCVVFALLARLNGIRIVSEIEDISVPALSDWRRSSETRPVQQLLYFPMMKCVLHLSHGVMIPTRRFEPILPLRKARLVVTGCLEDHEIKAPAPWPSGPDEPLELLFLGKYQAEHGLPLLVEALQLLRRRPELGRRFLVHCCGTVRFPDELVQLAERAGQAPRVILHGLLSREDYEGLLSRVHVGLVLQRSRGRHSRYKTPSKAYELLGAGKLVIATDVGDLKDLAPTHLICLPEETAPALVQALATIAADVPKHQQVAESAHKLSSREFSMFPIGRQLADFGTSLKPPLRVRCDAYGRR